MKTTANKENSASLHSSQPFFNKKGEGSFFSQTNEKPFFSAITDKYLQKKEQKESESKYDCTDALHEVLQKSYVPLIEEKFKKKEVNNDSLLELYNYGLRFIGTGISAVDKNGKTCCGIISRFIIFMYKDGKVEEKRSENSEKLGISAQAYPEADSKGNDFVFWFGVDECYV